MELLNTEEAARLLRIKAQTLEAMRSTKKRRRPGPPYVKVGRKVFYRRDHIMQWIDENTHRNWGEYPASDSGPGD